VIPSKGSGKVSHFQAFLPPFWAVRLRHVDRSRRNESLGSTCTRSRSSDKPKQRPLPRPMWKRNLTRPATGRATCVRAFSAPGCASPQSRPRAARGMRTRRIYPIYRPRAVHAPCRSRPAAMLCFLSLSRHKTHNTRAAGGAKPRRGAAGFLSFLGNSPASQDSQHVMPSVHSAMGWHLPADQTKHVEIQCYGQSLAEPPDRYPGVEKLRNLS
jgi:hypothetical protein